tara:strand:- start:14168 stop:15604 length:1437 start_codon:yes stop_codon:yes gene_type:complete
MSSPWKLTDSELFEVEQSHRELMDSQADLDAPIRCSLDNANLRARAEFIADELISLVGHADAEAYFAGAFKTAQADQFLRLGLQPGTTKNENGETYVLNRNHRWARTKTAEQPQRGKGKGRQPTGSRKPPADRESKKAPQRKADPGFDVKDYKPNVEADADNDGITDAARVGMPGNVVPPPPKKIPRIKGLKGKQKAAESDLAKRWEKDHRKMTQEAKSLARQISRAKDGPDGPVTYGTDDLKALSKYWSSEKLDKDPEARATNRSTLNVALHQTANAYTKAAFLSELDDLPEGANVLVTVGGVGAGKGYALKMVPEAQKLKDKTSVIWDSAGDQNATENVWIQKEAERRGLNVSYLFVNADAKTQWANKKFGVVQRARDLEDGRMVDAKIFSDSYDLGPKNHQKFYERNKQNPNASFMFLQTGAEIKEIPGIPPESLNADRKAIEQFAVYTIDELTDLPARIREGALQGQETWKGED